MEEAGSLIGELDPPTSSSSYALVGIGRGGGGGASEDDDEDTRGRDSPKRGKILLGVANVGGSLTVLLQIALVAWGVRQLRSFLARRRERIRVDPAFAMLSPVAVKRLVELGPVQYFFVDVRDATAVEEHPTSFGPVFRIPESELRASLQLSESEWETRFPSTKKPGQNNILVFVSTKGRRAQKAATAAADLGYSGCCVLAGGIEAYVAAESNHVDVPLKFLSRDAVATLLEKHEIDRESDISGSSSVHVLDVRRKDERALYGHIRGSQNIPVTELPKALTLDQASWEKMYHFPKFLETDIVIFQCHKNDRASWAAQVAQDFGFHRCFVYKDGVCGWRIDPTVLPYDSFALGDTPPDPINFEVEQVDYEAGRRELQQLGLA